MELRNNDYSKAYSVFGKSNKSPIILLSGWLHNFENEAEFVRKLSKYFKVVIIKYPGYYGVKDIKSLPSKNTFPDIVYGVIKKLKLSGYSFLGFSLGCQVVLNTVEKYKLKNKIILISPAMESLKKDAPYIIKLFLKNRKVFKFIRNNKVLSKIIVDLAYRKITKITENKRSKTNNFNNPYISLTGAFDTLYFGVTNFIDPRKYISQTKFIFGEKEVLQNKFKGKYVTIKDMGHGGFKTFSDDIISAIIN